MKWRKAKQWMLGVSAVIVGTVLVGVGLLVGILILLSWDMVAIEELQRVVSPDGAFTAILQSRDAGATTSTSQHVYLHYGQDSNTDSNERVFVLTQPYPLRLEWIADRTLQISCEQKDRIPRSEVFLQMLFSDGVDIRYSESLLPPELELVR